MRHLYLAPMIAFTSLLLAFAIVPVSPGWWSPTQHLGICLPDDGRAGGLRGAVCGLVK
ncbi:hypothetical protein ACNKHN_13395 [Shigella flexneri]